MAIKKKGIFIKKARKELESGKSKVGNVTPPTYLYRETEKYTILPTSKLNVIPSSLKSGRLMFRSLVSSENPSRKDGKTKDKKSPTRAEYMVDIVFHGIKYNSKLTARYNEEGKTTKGETVFWKKPSFNRAPVQVYCQCADFRHSFEHQLARAGGLTRPPRSYTRLTPAWVKGGSGRPYRNPTDKLGYCKHIHSFFKYLKENGHVSEL